MRDQNVGDYIEFVFAIAIVLVSSLLLYATAIQRFKHTSNKKIQTITTHALTYGILSYINHIFDVRKIVFMYAHSQNFDLFFLFQLNFKSNGIGNKFNCIFNARKST